MLPFSLICKISRALEDGLVAVGAVLYIETPFESLYRAAEEHGVDLNVVTWIHIMLSSRQILMAHMGCVSIELGFPHGEVPPTRCRAWWPVDSLYSSRKGSVHPGLHR
jgi:hypothetical protein